MLIFIKMDVNQLMWLNSMETEFLSCAEKMTINILFYYDLVNQGKGYTFLIKVKLYWNGDEKIADFSFSSAGCFFLSSMSFFFCPLSFKREVTAMESLRNLRLPSLTGSIWVETFLKFYSTRLLFLFTQVILFVFPW